MAKTKFKSHYSFKIHFISIKNPRALFHKQQLAHRVWKASTENFERNLITHITYPKVKTIALKWLKTWGHNSVKLNFISIKITHAHFLYVHNKYTLSEKYLMEIVGEVDYINTKIPYNAKKCLKWLLSKRRNSVKIKSSSIKNPRVHFRFVKFEKDPF